MGDLTDRVGRNLKGIINVRLIGVSFRRSLGTREISKLIFMLIRSAPRILICDSNYSRQYLHILLFLMHNCIIKIFQSNFN